MSNQDAVLSIGKADKDVDAANQLIKARSFFTSKEERYEKAIDLLSKACSAYKMGKSWEKAIDCYLKLYDLHTQLKETHDAVRALVEAGKLYKNTDPQKAIETYKKAINMYMNDNGISNAAKLWKEIVEIIVPNAPTETVTDTEIEKAIDACQNAFKLFEVVDQMVSANDMKLKTAVFYMRLKKYTDAGEMYELVSQYYLENGKNAWSVREYLFKAMICFMASGDLSSDQLDAKFTDYCKRLPALEGTREKQCLTKLLDAIREMNVEIFTTTVREYDTISKIDDLMCEILLVVKKNIEQGFTGSSVQTIDPVTGLEQDEIDLT